MTVHCVLQQVKVASVEVDVLFNYGCLGYGNSLVVSNIQHIWFVLSIKLIMMGHVHQINIQARYMFIWYSCLACVWSYMAMFCVAIFCSHIGIAFCACMLLKSTRRPLILCCFYIIQFSKSEHGIQEKCQYSLFPRILPTEKLDSSGWVGLWRFIV